MKKGEPLVSVEILSVISVIAIVAVTAVVTNVALMNRLGADILALTGTALIAAIVVDVYVVYTLAAVLLTAVCSVALAVNFANAVSHRGSKATDAIAAMKGSGHRCWFAIFDRQNDSTSTIAKDSTTTMASGQEQGTKNRRRARERLNASTTVSCGFGSRHLSPV